MVDKKIRLSQTIYNPEAYTYVTDHVFHQILCSTDEKLRTAQDILKRVIRRDMYPCIGVAYVVKGEEKTVKFCDEPCSLLNIVRPTGY
jgi:hypothetical protein